MTAKTDSTITVELRGGTTATVHVDASPRSSVEGATGAAGLDDVEVGMQIVASGEQNADGSIEASRVLAGTGRHPGGSRRGRAPRRQPCTGRLAANPPAPRDLASHVLLSPVGFPLVTTPNPTRQEPHFHDRMVEDHRTTRSQAPALAAARAPRPRAFPSPHDADRRRQRRRRR